MRPYYSAPDGISLYHGDCRAVLASLEPESVDCVVTSPPYLGLRAYEGVEPGIWGGSPECEHIWGDLERGKRKDILPADVTTLDSRTGIDDRQNGAATNGGRFCRRCNAWLGCYGNEPEISLYVAHTVEVCQGIWRVLKPSGTVWWNIGDSYSGSGHGPTGANSALRNSPNKQCYEERQGFTGSQGARVGSVHGESGHTSGCKPWPGLKSKDLSLIPYRVAIALQEAGWYVRSAITWAKKACMPESVTDRPTCATEMIWLLTKSPSYFFDQEAVRGFDQQEGIGQAAIVQAPNLTHKRLVLGNHFGTQNGATTHDARTPSGVVEARRLFDHCVELAASILQFAESQDQHGLSVLDSQVWQERTQDRDGTAVCCLPVVERAAMLATRFLHSDVTAKAFLQEFERLQVDLPDGHILRPSSVLAEMLDSPVVRGDADAAVRVNDARQVRQNQLIFHSPASCYQEYTAHTPTTSTGSRNLRNFLLLGPEPLKASHYAAFPSALPRMAILAGTSERGNCPTCGKPWVRQTETSYSPSIKSRGRPGVGTAMESGAGNSVGGWNDTPALDKHVSTLGWQPTCEHHGLPVPAVVLDPFVGSGTSLIVARQLGRRGIGIDASQHYLDSIAIPRIQGQTPNLFAEVLA